MPRRGGLLAAAALQPQLLLLLLVVVSCSWGAAALSVSLAQAAEGVASPVSAHTIWQPALTLQQPRDSPPREQLPGDDSASHYRRSLQQDALSNSNGCLATIPKCEANACATRNIRGVARWVCLRCVGNYEPVVDASGQDNIVQCVCPRGTYENATISTTTCTRCGFNSYCPGGDRSETPATLGSALSCGSGLITRTNGARSQVDCVAPAGYSMFSPTEARACGTSEYAPKFNRLPKCMRCQSGLEETPGNITDPGLRSSKRAVCKVPPGKFMSQGLVRPCAQGFYREQYLDFDHANAAVCLPCNPGITTVGPASKTAAECNRVIPGYGVSTISSNSSPLNAPVPTQTANGLPTAGVCPIGTYSQAAAGGYYCVQCPGNTVTRNQGAMAVEECAVPPGYFLPTGGNITQCLAGTFREGWVVYSDPKGASCTSCGAGITSEARDLDQNPLVTTTSYVRGSSSSCYIDAGQGMIAQGSNTFAGMDCPVNTYGAAGRVYGWASAPCKPCPRNMVTDTAKSSSSDACVNPDGFGYASEGAFRCAPSFYAARGTRRPCQRCPEGRTTLDDPAKQRFLTDCVVEPGNGVAFNLNGATAADVFNGGLVSYTDEQLLGFNVLQCPQGFYGIGLELGGTCKPCPPPSTTEEAGATDISQCSVCNRGYGKTPPSSECELCPYGTWQSGGFATCIACESTTFAAPIDGAGPPWTVPGITLAQGSVGAEWCVPTQSQLSPEAGQAYFGPRLQGLSILSINANKASLGECFELCATDKCCFMQLDTAKQTCTVATLPPAGRSETGLQLMYKLPANTLSSASSIAGPAKAASVSQAGRNSSRSRSSRSRQNVGISRDASLLSPRMSAGARPLMRLPGSVKAAAAASGSTSASASASSSSGVVRAKTLPSGWFASCVIPPNERADWLSVGTPLRPDARTFTRAEQEWFAAASVYACSEVCDNSVVCSHFLWDPSSSKCLFRAGEDALATRSFFQLPAPGSITGLITGSGSFFYAFSASGVTKATLSDALQTAYAAAVVGALAGVASPEVLAMISVWVDVAADTPDGTVLLGFFFADPEAARYQTQLDAALAPSNVATTLAIADGIVVAAKESNAPELQLPGSKMLAGATVDPEFTTTTLGVAVALPV